MKPIETSDDLYAARHALGLSAAGLAKFLRLGDAGERTVRRWQSGESDIPGPVAVLLGLLLASPASRKAAGLPAELVKPARK